jgi:Flp pilus assembly pilin Flp
MNEPVTQHQKGQGLVEYALILALVAVGAISGLVVLGPVVGGVFGQVAENLEPVVGVSLAAASEGPIVDVSARRTGFGYGNDVVVRVTVSESTTVTATDSQSGRSATFSCSDTCQDTITGVGPDAGTISATVGFDLDTASYPPKL